MNNRLQFRHHTPIFNSREEAVEYVKSQVRFAEEGLASSDKSHGFSLYAEPTVLRYNDENDTENGPYVILAIGSETNEGTQYNENKFTIIDTHKTEVELEEIHEDIEKAVKSLSIITKDTDTLKLYSEKTDDGTIISGDVAVAESQILNDVKKPNIILATEDGLFTYVDLEYDIETHVLSFTVNGETKDMDLGIENFYVEKGYYSTKDESIHLLRNDGEEIVIDLDKLIGEWGVEGEASNTPIVLTKEEVEYGDESDTHNHVEPWQDVLKADVRLLDAKRNILKKTVDGKYLYVDGVAKNIAYFKDGKEMSVQEALDEFKVDVSTDSKNIIYEKADGLYAGASLKYVSKENKLVFTTSNVTGGTTEEEIVLNSVELFTDMIYDPTTEELVIVYTDSKDTNKTVRIPIGKMMMDWEWDIENDGHNVKLHKTRNVSGNDKVSADVDIFMGHNNILEDVNHQLYVRGEADNIKYGKDGNVADELDKLNEFTSDIDDRLNETSGKVESTKSELDAEIERATENEARIETKLDAEVVRSTEKDSEHDAEIKRLDETIGDGFTTDGHETVTYKFEALSAKTDAVSAKTDTINANLELLSAKTEAEIVRAKSEESRIETKFDNALGEGFDIRNTVKDAIDNETAERKNADDKLQAEIDELSADTASRLIDLINKDKSIDVNKEDPIRPVIKVNLSNEVEDGKPNIIKLNADGLYAGVDLDYVFNEENGSNQLVFKTTQGTKTFDLKTNSVVDKIYYDASQESLVVEYTVNGVRQDDVIIPVSSLITEWRIYDGHEGAVQLYKERKDSASTDGNQDVLKAEVIITETHEDNILVNDNGALYVSNKDIMKNKADIEDLNKKLDEEIERATDKEDEIQDQLDELYDTYLIEFVDTNTVNLNKVRKPKGYEIDANVKLDTTEGNIIKATDGGLYATTELSYNATTNTLTFVNTNKTVEIPLVSNSLIDEVYYDPAQEAIVIRYTVNGTAMPNVVVPVRSLINEVDYASTQTVTLTKTVNDANGATVGADIVTADVNISSEKEQGLYENLIKLNADGLYVGAHLDYRFDEEDGKSILTFRTSTGTTEIELKTPSIIDDIVYDPTDESLVIYYYVNGKLENTRVPLGDLIDEWRTSEDTSGAIKLEKQRDETHGKDILWGEVLINETRGDNILEKVNGTLYVSSSAITQNTSDIEALGNSRLTTITTDNSMLVDSGHTSTSLTPSLSVQVSGKNNLSTNVVPSGEPFGNLIEVYEDGIYASIDVEYISGADKNTLVFKTTKGKKEIDLVSNADIKSLAYNNKLEQLELTFGVNGEEKVITCDVSDLIDEWDIENPIDNAVLLYKAKNHAHGEDSAGPNILSADVKISAAPTNILQKLGTDSPYGGGTLFVDGSQISANTSAIESIQSGLTDVSGAIDSNYSEFVAISGRVETLESGLASEVERATNAENALRNDLNAEIDRATAAENKIEDKLDAEIERSVAADNELKQGLTDETNRATRAEEKIAHDLEDEAKAREIADNELIKDLNSEIRTREKEVEKLTTELAAETATRDADDKAIRKDLSDETNERIKADSDLDKLITEEAKRAENAETVIQSNIDKETNRATLAENNIQTALEQEIARSTKEDEGLWEALRTEIDNRSNGDEDLKEAIRKATLTFAETTSVKMVKSDSNVVTSTVKLANADNNIITIDGEKQGVYASVKLSYNPGTNKIQLVTSTGAQEEIQLNGVSVIKDMVYDPTERVLKMHYETNDGQLHEVVIPANQLFNDWVIDNPSEQSAIELTKTLASHENGVLDEGGPDRLSARILLTNLEDNMVQIVNNGLYVSSAKMDEALETANCAGDALTKVVEAIFGKYINVMANCGEGFAYVPPVGDIYEIIKDATSINDVLKILVQKHNELKQYIDIVSGQVESISSLTECITSEVHNLERNVLGVSILSDCGKDAAYQANPTSCIISAATSMNSADILLDNAVCKINDGLDCLTDETKRIEKVLGIVGNCDTEIIYPVSMGCLLSDVETYAAADLKLEAAVCELMKMMVGSDTATANLVVKEEGANKYFEVNVRLSHGNARAQEGVADANEYMDVWQDDSELYIKNFIGKEVEDGYREFTDTNVLRIVDLTEEPPQGFGYKPTSWFNGIYLSNYWNCGKYYQEATEQDEIEAMKAEGYTNLNKDLTDERPSEQDIFNQRYRNFVKK